MEMGDALGMSGPGVAGSMLGTLVVTAPEGDETAGEIGATDGDGDASADAEHPATASTSNPDSHGAR
jgi:hypothetical protein